MNYMYLVELLQQLLFVNAERGRHVVLAVVAAVVRHSNRPGGRRPSCGGWLLMLAVASSRHPAAAAAAGVAGAGHEQLHLGPLVGEKLLHFVQQRLDGSAVRSENAVSLEVDWVF